MKSALALGVLVALAAASAAQAESKRDKAYPELKGWENPYAVKGARQDDRVRVIRPPQTDVLGTPREPLGGGDWDRITRGSRR
jgi:hypothetical protein